MIQSIANPIDFIEDSAAGLDSLRDLSARKTGEEEQKKHPTIIRSHHHGSVYYSIYRREARSCQAGWNIRGQKSIQRPSSRYICISHKRGWHSSRRGSGQGVQRLATEEPRREARPHLQGSRPLAIRQVQAESHPSRSRRNGRFQVMGHFQLDLAKFTAAGSIT